jgi:hypothetical protein
MKIFWPNKITNGKIHNNANPDNMRILLTKSRWLWIGHVLRKPPTASPKYFKRRKRETCSTKEHLEKDCMWERK